MNLSSFKACCVSNHGVQVLEPNEASGLKNVIRESSRQVA